MNLKMYEGLDEEKKETKEIVTTRIQRSTSSKKEKYNG